MNEERAADNTGTGAENPDASATSGQAPEEAPNNPTLRQRVTRRRRGAAGGEQTDGWHHTSAGASAGAGAEAPEAEREGEDPEQEEQPLSQEPGEPLICAICNKLIEGEHIQAAYGPVHTGDCSHRTKRVV